MTLLFFDLQDSQAFIVTDTLMTADDGSTPSDFKSKVWTHPIYNMIIAMTGTAEIGELWSRHVENTPGSRDIEDLHQVAPSALRAIHEDLTANFGDIGTSTIYHFGFARGSDNLTAYAYRSMDGYAGERIERRGFWIKPDAVNFTAQEPATNEEVVELASRIKDEQASLMAAGEPGVGIGGELYSTLILNHAIQHMLLHRFPDYEDSWQAMWGR